MSTEIVDNSKTEPETRKVRIIRISCGSWFPSFAMLPPEWTLIDGSSCDAGRLASRRHSIEAFVAYRTTRMSSETYNRFGL
jgi:hypothetical protein